MPFASKSGGSVGFLTSLFTSTSAVCVTGHSVVDIFTTFTFFGQLVILLLVQFGGLGFMTMAALVLVMLGKRLSLKDKLSVAESFSNDDISSVIKIAKTLALTAVVVELVGALGVLPAFLQLEGGTALAVWRSLFHAVASFCNAGFDLMGGTGMTPFVGNPLFNITTIVLIFCGGIGASVLVNIGRKVKHKERMSFNSKMIVVSSLVILLCGALYIFVAEYNNPLTLGNLAFGDKVLAAFFQSMTTRSAGFSTINQGGLTAGGFLASNLLMVIGVSPASTGGGIKIATVVVLLASLRTSVTGGEEYHILKRGIGRKTFNKAVSILVFYLLALLVALMILCLTDGQFTLEQLVFEGISALSNVGLTTGITGSLSAVGQLVLIALMYLGRAGFLCIVYTVVGSGKVNIKYPDCKIIIG